MSILDTGAIPPEVIAQWEGNRHPAFATTGSRKRSTYTLANATLFQPFFDKVISSNQPQALPWTCIHVRPKTLYVKVCDALKWLCENGTDADRMKYLMLKASFKLEPNEGGITLTYRNTKHGGTAGVNLSKLALDPKDLKTGVTVIGSQVREVTGNNVQDLLQDVISWKEDLASFVNNPKNVGEKIEITFDAGINDHAKEFIEGICSMPDIEYVYKGNVLVVCKIMV